MRKFKTTHTDSNGRLVLPAEIRKAWGLREEDLVTVYMEDDKIVIEKAVVKCPYCGSDKDIVRFYTGNNHFILKDLIGQDELFVSRKKDTNEHHICLSCLQKLKAM
ncbi:MAG: AbrB/MazE/SpoVT family DNA-binding domain-containing protein [Oscillospiraceae bacterium]|nr:AbrB/MazE/SpoVT family DNA-binding domain-containing protein [Oscillospiraceae bacterium]